MKKIIFCAAALFATTASAAIPPSEREALIAIYNATAGQSWFEKSGWLGAAGTECDWAGVDCDDAESTVVSVQLYDNNLNGQLPAAIGQLANLETLVLDRNQLSGPIPASIGQLSKLKLFHTDGNQFTSIPREIGNLAALEDLDFSYNALTGSIPPEIGQLSNLVSLELGSNELSGNIPSSIGNLTRLQHFGASINSLTGAIPQDLSRLTDLAVLDLSYNLLEGTFPSFLPASLEELDLGHNQFAGPIPGEIARFTNLRFLSLFANAFEGPLPIELFGITSLEELSLYDNDISGPLPPQFGNLTNLIVLLLSGNALTGPIPRELGSLTDLDTIDLLDNDLSGTIPVELGQLKALTWLDLAANNLTGTIPRELGSLPALQFFSLYENQLEGPIPPELGNLSNLHTLYLTSNRLTGTIPDALRNLTNLESFWLGGNRLTGEIPSWIGELTKLHTIYFPGNQLTGVIPPAIGNLTNLSNLYLGNNRLTGSIPREIGNLPLAYLSLESNEISGPIPPEFWQLSDLVEIRLNDMALSGSLPAEIGNLRKADVFLLNHNQLEGTIPPEIGNLESVLYLSLGANRLTGPIPREIGRLSGVLQLDLYDNALRGAIPPEITGMTSLEDASSDFGFNALTADPVTLEFVNGKQYDGDLLLTQTLTPPNVRVVQTTDRSVTLEWDLIRYLWDGGGYQVTVKNAAGTTVAIVTTDSKESPSIVVRGLAASTQYHFTVATVTHPHDQQKNIIVSDPSPTVVATTTARVVAPPDVALTESTTGLVQIDGTPVNEDSFTLTNFGDVETSVSLLVDGDFYTIDPVSFTLGAGESQRVIVRSVTKPADFYYGYVDPNGEGVGDDIYVPVTLLSTVRPAGTVIAEALSSRVEVAGAPGSDSVGQARFRNRGTASLSGVVVSDQPWVVPSSDAIVIHPNEVGTVNFTVMRSRRPPEATGALTANLKLVYVDGSVADGSRIITHGETSGVSVTLVTIVDTPKPPVAPSSLPGIGGGEVAWFAPGISSFASGGHRFISDVSILNGATRAVDDLRLYFTPVGGSSSVATMSAITPAQSLALANVVTNVYDVDSAIGSLQFRTSAWQSIAPFAQLVTAGSAGLHLGDVPVFRSDRAAGPGQRTYLTGLRKSASMRTDVFIQETGGAAAAVTLSLLDANGAVVGTHDANVPGFGMAELTDVATAATVTAIVTNSESSDGQIVAYARVTDMVSGDTWSVPDWSRRERFSTGEAVRIPIVSGAAPPPSSGGGRRRAVAHATTIRTRTEVSIFNPSETEARARLQLVQSNGQTASRDIVVAPARTTTITDAGATASTPNASLIVTPLAGAQIVVSARSAGTVDGSHGTAVPVVPASAGLRVGQSQRFPGLSDSTSASVAASRPGTFRTSFGFVETSGRSAVVRARLYLDAGRDLVSAIIYRDFTVGPGEQVVADNLVQSIIGSGRDALGELSGVQLHVEVISGGGSVIPFVVVADNATGDTILRLE